VCCARSLAVAAVAAAAARRTAQTYGSQKLKWEKGYPSTVVEWNYNARKIYLLSSIAGTFGPWSRKTRISSLTNATPRLRTRRRPKGISEEFYRSPVHAWPQSPNAGPNRQLRRLQICLSGNDDGALDGKLCDQLKYTHAGLPKD
jgi:hypothetical protein